VKTIDVHAHCLIPAASNLLGEDAYKHHTGGIVMEDATTRLRAMDAQGIDMEALSINPFWYEADSDIASEVVRLNNEALVKICARNPDRFVAFASVALQFPDLAAQQLEDGVKRLGLRGASIGGHVNGEDLSLPKFDPFWAKAAELCVPVVMHPGGADNIIKDGALGGRGDLGNIIGNPLETTYFLTRMIFDGVFDRHPNLKVGAAHAGGYLPSYVMRTDVACEVRNNANCANKKKPKEYLRSQILVDTMVFSDEGLKHLVNELGVSQIVYGTDNPLNWPVTVDLVLNASWLSNADKEAILGGNLIKLLRITSS
jgi:aminocarboxymuconate-semialdehyde decarboxylase